MDLKMEQQQLPSSPPSSQALLEFGSVFRTVTCSASSLSSACNKNPLVAAPTYNQSMVTSAHCSKGPA